MSESVRCPRCDSWHPPISNCAMCDGTRRVSKELDVAYHLISKDRPSVKQCQQLRKQLEGSDRWLKNVSQSK